jgi:integrase
MTNLAAQTECGSQERKTILMTRKRSYQRGAVISHNDQWTLRYREFDHTTGKWTNRRVVLGKFKNKKTALKAAEPIMAQVNERNNMEPQKLYEKITFKEFIHTRWESYRKAAKHQPSTVVHHDSLTKNHLMPFFGNKKLREVQPSDVSKFLQMKKDEKLSDNTMQNLYGMLRLMFEIAEQFDLIEKSPVRPKLHKLEFRKVEKPTLSTSQIRLILKHLATERDRLFVLLLAVTGMRMGEALALRWIDFNASKGELTINHTLFRQTLKPPKTESSRNTLKLNQHIAALLLWYKAQSAFQTDEDFIICRADGLPMNPCVVRKILYDAMDKAEIKRVKGQYGFHIFRHSAGTLLYTRSRDLKLVQGTLRHADISTTSDIYVHLDDLVLDEGTEILTGEVLGDGVLEQFFENCSLTVPQQSQMVS